MLDGEIEPEHRKGVTDSADDLAVRVGYPQDGLAEAAFGIEDACQESGSPFARCLDRPFNQRFHRLELPVAVEADPMHRPMAIVGRLELELLCGDIEIEEVILRAKQCLGIAQRQTEAADRVDSAPRVIDVILEVAIAPDHPAEVSAPVVVILALRLRESSRTEQAIVGGEVRTAFAPPLGPHDMLPSSFGHEPMIGAGDYFGSILEGHPERWFDAAPMG